MRVVYYANDGTEFETEKECRAYEEKTEALLTNLEVLKAAADKLGYRLAKKQPYVPFPQCSCNPGKGINRYQTVGGYFYRCPICRKESKPARLASEAAMNWNNGIWRNVCNPVEQVYI